jgi:hypothetical protein
MLATFSVILAKSPLMKKVRLWFTMAALTVKRITWLLLVINAKDVGSTSKDPLLVLLAATGIRIALCVL